MGRLPGAVQPGNGTSGLGAVYKGNLVDTAHALGLQVHAYTLRNEVRPTSLPP